MDGFGWIAVMVVALFGFGIWTSYQADKKFEAKMQSEYQGCVDHKESEYTCKAYIESMRARRSADSAETMSAVSVGMSAGKR